MKECPFCAEQIQDEAIKCRHCGSDLLAPPPLPSLETLSLDDRGGTLTFSKASPESLADEFERFFNSLGFTLEDGDKINGTYCLGAWGARFVAGAFVKRQKYKLRIASMEGGVKASVVSAMSGWSGGLIGARKEKRSRKEFNAQLQSYFSQFRRA